MKTTNKKILFLILLFCFFAFAPKVIFASEVEQFVWNVENAVNTIAGSIVVIGWFIAGILYLTAAGNPEKTGIAKKAMIAAIIGTVLVILATMAEAIIDGLLHGN